MRSYNVTIMNGKKAVGRINGLLANNPRHAEQEAVKRYKNHWNLPASVCLIGMPVLADVPSNPKVGDTLKVGA